MHRRSLLRKAGTALAAVGAAGCLQRGPAARRGGGGGPGTDASTGETDTGSATPTAEPTHTAEQPSETPDGTATLDDTETPAETETATPEPVSRPRLVDTDFEMRSVGPATGDDEATVRTDETTVIVRGTIPGSNGCYRAELAAADHEDGRLTVLVRSYEDADEDTACTQSIVAIDYRAVFTFEGALPDTVQVDHEAMGQRKTVTTTSLD